MGVCWWAGDIPRLLVTSSRACCIGLTTVGAVGRPGRSAGGDFFGASIWWTPMGMPAGTGARCVYRVRSTLWA